MLLPTKVLKKMAGQLLTTLEIMLRLCGKLAVDGVPEIHCIGNSAEFGLADAGSEQRNQSCAKQLVFWILPANDVIHLVQRKLTVANVEESVFGDDALVGQQVFEIE